MADQLKVFVSRELREMSGDNEIARETVRSMGFDPRGFEDVPASPQRVEDGYLEEVRGADVVIFLVGRTLAEGVAKEYREAERLGKPRLVFVKDVGEDQPRRKACRDFLRQVETPLSGVTVKHYGSLDELRNEIRKALALFVTWTIRQVLPAWSSHG